MDLRDFESQFNMLKNLDPLMMDILWNLYQGIVNEKNRTDNLERKFKTLIALLEQKGHIEKHDRLLVLSD